MSELTEEEFTKFKERLYFHNIDREGVDRHITANPIFNVQNKKRIYGVSDDYTDKFIWNKDEVSFDSLEDFIEGLEDEELEAAKEYCANEGQDFDGLGEYAMTDIAELLGYVKCGYIEEWEHVNSHLTREGAEAFIARKKHDYSEMRVWVGSQYLCWEFNEIIKGILDGDIGYIKK